MVKRFSIAELTRQPATVTAAAFREPVTLTHHRKPRFVLMTVEDYGRLAGANGDPRRVYGSGETPADIAAALLPQLDRLIAEGEGDGS
jgi:hypothetical protein